MAVVVRVLDLDEAKAARGPDETPEVVAADVFVRERVVHQPGGFDHGTHVWNSADSIFSHEPGLARENIRHGAHRRLVAIGRAVRAATVKMMRDAVETV